MVSYLLMMTVVVMSSEVGETFTVNHLKRLIKALAVVTEIQSATRYLLSAHHVPTMPLRSL